MAGDLVSRIDPYTQSTQNERVNTATGERVPRGMSMEELDRFLFGRPESAPAR
jgi:hypothetical protein